jgi:hypothetical protein
MQRAAPGEGRPRGGEERFNPNGIKKHLVWQVQRRCYCGPTAAKGGAGVRARNLRPDFFSNDRLGQCTPLARLLYLSLSCQADKSGRLEDRPLQIRARGLPFDNCDCDAMLTELAAAGLIVRYDVNGLKLIEIHNFENDHNPHPNEKESDLPGCDSGEIATCPDKSGKIATNREKQCTAPADPSPSPDPIKRAPDPAWPGFDKFCDAYPRKTAKVQAQAAWKKLRPDDALLGQILKAIKRQKQSPQWREEPKFIPYPSTWLNGRRWEDEVEPTASNGQALTPADLGPVVRPTETELESLFAPKSGKDGVP